MLFVFSFVFVLSVHQEDENGLEDEVEHIGAAPKRIKLMADDGTAVDDTNIIHEVSGIEVMDKHLMMYCMLNVVLYFNFKVGLTGAKMDTMFITG